MLIPRITKMTFKFTLYDFKINVFKMRLEIIISNNDMPIHNETEFGLRNVILE